MDLTPSYRRKKTIRTDVKDQASGLFFEEAMKNLGQINNEPSDFNLEEMKEAFDYKKGEKFARVVRVAWSISRCLRLLKIKRKMVKHRKYVIEELVKTEQQYLDSLALIVEKLMKESLREKILTKEESDKIFCNVESIYLFHKEFYSNLKKSYENFTKTTKVANGIFKMLPFFKLYYLYCNNFHHSNEEIDKMKLNQHPFTEKIKKIEFTEEMQNLDLSSLLIKPVQRLPKYVLLFKDLMKNTEENHPDYHDIAQCLLRFQEINQENNSKMNIFIKKRKVIELDNKFGKEVKKELNIEIVDPQREFLEEEALHIILDNMPKPVICYFFCDLILVTETIKGETLIKFLILDHNSYVRDLANQKYFKWIFSVYGKDGGLTFSTDSKESKKKMMKFIELNILQNLREKADLKMNLKKQCGQESFQKIEIQNDPKKIQVHVLGTMKRGYYNRTYTVYVIEITYELNNEKVSTKIFFRYSELSKLNALIKQDFPSFGINHLPPKYWFSSQKTKTIESRKLLIETFLQSVLSKEDLIKKSKNKILNVLGLAEYFNYKPTIEDRSSQHFLSVANEMPEEKEISEKFGRISVFSAIAESHKSHMPANRMSKLMTNMDSIELNVRLMNTKHVKVSINKYTKASEVCEEIAADINLQSSLDFKLFIFHNNEDIRIIQDDEYLLKALDLDNWENVDREDNKEKEERKTEGFFATFKKKVESKFSKLKNNIKGKITIPDVIYKKYLYLPSIFEENDMKLDPVKMELISAQIFDDIHNFKYILNLEEYSLIASLQAYIEHGRYEDCQEDIFLIENICSRFLPQSIFARKGDKFWHDNIANKWKKLSIEINQICQKSVNSLKSTFSPNRKSSDNLTDNKMVARLIAINSMKKHKLYGGALYWVNFHKKSDTPEISVPIPDNLWLAIKFTSLALLYPDDKREFMEFSYSQIMKFSSYPTSIEISTEKNNFRFNTPHSFEIYQLIDEYEKLHKLLPEMKNKKAPSILRKNSYDINI